MPLQRRLRYAFFGLLLGFTACSCAVLEVKTEGEGWALRWYTTHFRHFAMSVGKREVYQYTLVLEELRGTTVTLTEMQAQFRNNFQSRRFDWKKSGQ